MGLKDALFGKKRLTIDTESGQHDESGAQDGSTLNKLAALLLPAIDKRKGNAVISPSCLYQSLALLSEMTAGRTKSQIMELLGPDAAEALDSICDIEVPSDGCKDFHYSTASSIWLDKRVHYNEDFPKREGALLPIEVERVEMGTSATAVLMGEWLSEATSGMYAEGPKTNPATNMVALGAMHLKDSWQDEFDEDDPRPFFLEDGTTMNGDFMYAKEDCGYLEADGAVTWEKPLSSGCRMVVSMPPEGTSLSDYIANGSAWANMKSLFDDNASVEWGECEVRVPKFDMSSDGLDMTRIVNSLGITEAFEPSADFSPLASSPLMVDAILQSTHLKIDEEGLEGASYVEIMMFAGLPPEDQPDPKQLVFDRPFAVAVFSPKGAPLFVGSMRIPAEGGHLLK